MTDLVVAAVQGVVQSWNEEVERRRQMSKNDVSADILEYCASEITDRLKAVEHASRFLTVAQFARREEVTEQTVRNWIRKERIAAIETPKGYKIDASQIAPLGRSR